MAKKIKKKYNVPPGNKRLTIRVNEKVRYKLRIEAVKRDTTIGEIIKELVNKHL